MTNEEWIEFDKWLGKRGWTLSSARDEINANVRLEPSSSPFWPSTGKARVASGMILRQATVSVVAVRGTDAAPLSSTEMDEYLLGFGWRVHDVSSAEVINVSGSEFVEIRLSMVGIKRRVKEPA